MRIIGYDRQAAVEYARKWAFSRNPAYYNFNGIGGDCTNFASQCLFAGCRVMNFTPDIGWFYRSSNDRSAAWTGVEYFYNFFVNHDGVGPYAREVPVSEVRPGDVVQLARANGDFYHTPFITAIRPTILVAAHSEDSLDRPLYSYNFASLRFLHIEGVRIDP